MEFSVYLAFNGTCAEAMNFYKEALGANMVTMQRFSDMPPNPNMPVAEEDKNKVLHCSIEKDGQHIMASDSNSKHPVTFGNNATISVNLHSDEEIERVFNAISAGGNVTMRLGDTFWGAKFGMCTDNSVHAGCLIMISRRRKGYSDSVIPKENLCVEQRFSLGIVKEPEIKEIIVYYSLCIFPIRYH